LISPSSPLDRQKFPQSQTRHFVTIVQVLSIALRHTGWKNLLPQLALSIADAAFPAALHGPGSSRANVAGSDAVDATAGENAAKQFVHHRCE
jgi:hypothetical protein